MNAQMDRRDHGIPLVLLHGWGSGKAVWAPLLAYPAFAARQTFAIDLPGYGASASCKPYTLDALVSRVAAAAPARCVVAGWSLGGEIALRWAASAPSQVAALVLIGTTPCFVARPDWPHGMARDVFDGFSREFAAAPRNMLERFALLSAQGDHGAREVARQLRRASDTSISAQPAALAGGLDLLRDVDLRAELVRVQQPALVLHGDADQLVSVRAGMALAAALPAGRFERIAGAAHAPLVSQPQAVADFMDEFLDERRVDA